MGLYVGKTTLWYNTIAVRRHLSDNDLIRMTVTPLSTNESSRLPVKQRNFSSRLLWVVIPDLLRDTIYRVVVVAKPPTGNVNTTVFVNTTVKSKK